MGPEPVAADASASIYVIQRGWHTDIGLPTADLHGQLAQLSRDIPGSRYLIFGFGDRHYVLARDKNLGGMLAALWPGPGLILVTGLVATPERAFGADHVIRFAVERWQSAAVVAFVWRSMSTTAGQLHPYASGPYAGSLFYASPTTYDGWHTCNTWTAEALRAGDLPFATTGVVLSAQVWDQARALAARNSEVPRITAGSE